MLPMLECCVGGVGLYYDVVLGIRFMYDCDVVSTGVRGPCVSRHAWVRNRSGRDTGSVARCTSTRVRDSPRVSCA